MTRTREPRADAESREACDATMKQAISTAKAAVWYLTDKKCGRPSFMSPAELAAIYRGVADALDKVKP